MKKGSMGWAMPFLMYRVLAEFAPEWATSTVNRPAACSARMRSACSRLEPLPKITLMPNFFEKMS